MKKTVSHMIVVAGLIASVVLNIVALVLLSVPLFISGISCLVGTAVLGVILFSLSEIADNFKEFNERLAKNKDYHLEIDDIRADEAEAKAQAKANKPSRSISFMGKIDYANAKCSNCKNNIMGKEHCRVYDERPFNGEIGYCDSYNPIQ